MEVINNRIGGESRQASNGAWYERRNPADRHDLVSRAPESSPSDVATAVRAALDAFADWAASGPTKRSAVLERAASIIDKHASDWARDLVREQGKPLADATNELSRAAANLRLYAGEAFRITGTTFQSDSPHSSVAMTRGPVGVVGVITPWNFPLTLASRKIGPALAAGNTVVFKPSPMTPLLGDRLAQAFDEADLPPGVLNVVHGAAAGQDLSGDTRLAALTFTGSTAVGERILADSSLTRRVQLELGGNNPVVVLDDADLTVAADVVARSSFSLTGQACTGAGRILVTPGIHDALLEEVVRRARAAVLGNGLKEGVTCGPLIDSRARDAMVEVVGDAVDDGALISAGGSTPTDPELGDGWFFPPTVLSAVTPEMRVASEEVFGPVIGFELVDDLAEAIERSNKSEYGLSAAICTTSLANAYRFCDEVEAGMLKVNQSTVGIAPNVPFGGVKRSSTETNREQLGPTVMEFFTRSRMVFTTFH